uniref:Uncharacterized protein n=1 Tax=Oryza punctata TaxID=4537 RepID=A0A0E0ME11_ORYPU
MAGNDEDAWDFFSQAPRQLPAFASDAFSQGSSVPDGSGAGLFFSGRGIGGLDLNSNADVQGYPDVPSFQQLLQSDEPAGQ